MTHDPMCPRYKSDTEEWWDMKCFCDGPDSLIRRVREDERDKHINPGCVWGEGECLPDCPSCKRMDEFYAEWCKGHRAGVEDAAQAVEALALPYALIDREWAIEAIRGLVKDA